MPTFYDRFAQCAERWPDKIAVEIQTPESIESYTYAQLRKMAEALAAWLVASGTEPGARVAILAENHPRWVAAYLGIIAAGATTVPLDTAYRPDQVATLLKDSGAALLVCDQKHWEVARDATAESGAALLLTALPTALRSQPSVDFDTIFAQPRPAFTPVPRAPDDLASLLYTSGTTADPKGVMLTHANLLGEAEGVFDWAHIGPEDAVLGILPLFHVLSQMANLLLPLVAGARVVYLSTLNTTELLRALRERSVTAFAVVPQFFYLIHDRIFKEVKHRGWLVRSGFNLMRRLTVFCRRLGFNPGRVLFRRIHNLFGKRMRLLVTGGSRFDPKIASDFYSIGIDVLQAYGLTETSGGAFINQPRNNVIGSVGKPLKGVEVKIVDAQLSDESGLARGEIVIRGSIVMKGYWQRPDATAAVLQDGWLYTGDLGYLDRDRNLFITGRKKEVIILANGKNIFPEEIEAHYLQSPFIQQICVLGVDGTAGSDKLYGVVVPNFEVLRQRKVVNAREVIRFDIEGLSAKLPSTKRISSYEIWQQDLPRTSTRKIKRFEVEEAVRAGKRAAPGAAASSRLVSPEDAAWLAQPAVRKAVSVIRQYATTNPESIHPNDNLELDLGLDSMRRVELLVAIEHELGGDLKESAMSDIYTVRELVEAVMNSAASEKAQTKQEVAGWGTVLRQDPVDAAALRIVKPRPIVDRLLLLVVRLPRIVWRLRAPVEVAGMQNLPSRGPYLLCSNHQSFLDPLLLLSVLPARALLKLFAVGTSDIFHSAIMLTAARILRVVVVDPDANLVPAMRAGAFGLRHGMGLVLYPEGERSIDGTPKTFKKGAAILSIHLQVPIVPLAIEGFYDSWPRGQPFRKFSPLRMRFGKPMLPPPEAEASEEAYARLTAELKATVVAMWEEVREARPST
jgi:long-chain acyl-CoA synthetase